MEASALPERGRAGATEGVSEPALPRRTRAASASVAGRSVPSLNSRIRPYLLHGTGCQIRQIFPAYRRCQWGGPLAAARWHEDGTEGLSCMGRMRLLPGQARGCARLRRAGGSQSG